MDKKLKKNNVIAYNNLPQRLPLWSTITCCLALDYWNAPSWMCGAIGFVLIIGWAGSVQNYIKQKEVDLLKKDE